MNGETRSEFNSVVETPIPRECDSNKKTNLKETRGETRKTIVRIWLREARGEVEEREEGCCSGKASALQAVARRCPYLPCNRISMSSFLPSCPSPLSGAAPARSSCSGPTSLPCQCSQTPAQLLCAQLCPAASP